MDPNNLDLAIVLVKNLGEANEKVEMVKSANEIRVGNVNHKGVSASFMINDLKCKDILIKELLEITEENVSLIKKEIENL